jgi:hypothetical protein
VGDAEVEEA